MIKKFLPLFILLTSLLHAERPVAYFSHKDKIVQQLVRCIQQEEQKIQMAVYTISHRGVIHALLQAKKRGVVVELLVDPASLRARTSLARLAEAGVALFIWQSPAIPKGNALMHHKFCLFGNRLLWTGSCNFTLNADRLNQENALLLDDGELVRQYRSTFEELKRGGAISYDSYLKKQIEEKGVPS